MTSEQSELWLPVPGFADYEVSSFGRVRSWKTTGYGTALRRDPRELRLHPVTRGGYLYCKLSRPDTKKKVHCLVHRLVLEAFVGPCPDGMQCRHFPDRTTTNNRLSNLSWGTPIENSHDRVAHGTQASGSRHGSVTKPHRVPRGDRHKSRTKPESVARGERHGSRTHPERLARAWRNGSRANPERLERGSKRHNAKLTEGSARVVMMFASEPMVSDRELGEAFGISTRNVNYIRNGKAWRHVRD